MSSELLPYYERELIFIRKLAAEFAEQYPERAGALRISPHGCDDPHVERMIEAFALIAGRIQHKLDEEFPEITNSLLELLYPHLLRPVPSVAIVQMEVDPVLSRQRGGQSVPRGATIYSDPIQGVQCRFRTAYSTRLWPLGISSAAFGSSTDLARGATGGDARHALRIELQVLGGGKLADFDLRDLRFRIGGDSQAAHWIYELLLSRVKRILIKPTAKDAAGRRRGDWQSAVLGPASVSPVGFARDESLLPVAETSFQGYRLMQEYFCFPQKFLFFDLSFAGSDPLVKTCDGLEIVFLIDAPDLDDRAALLEAAVNADTFQLGCTPAINLFEQTAEPIRLSHTRTEYQVVPDVYAPLSFEVYSVDRVLSVTDGAAEPKEYRPFYSFQRGLRSASAIGPECFWLSSRRPSSRSGDAGSDVFLSFVDRDFKLMNPASEAVTVRLTSSNRDLPAQLNLSGAARKLDLESSAMIRARLVQGPSGSLRPSFRGDLQWRLVSHLSLNHLSLVDGGVDALREILHLYDPMATQASKRQIDGLTAIRSARKLARLSSEQGFVVCQGIAIEAEMDEENFAGGAFLLASVLERFFGLYCAVNSFTQLLVSTRQRRGVVWQWPIRSGEQAVA